VVLPFELISWYCHNTYKKSILLLTKDALNWSKVTFIMLQQFSTSNKCCPFELSIQTHYSGFTKISSSTTFNFDNKKKCFMNSILEWFLKIQFCHHRNKLHFKMYSNKKTIILNCNYIFHSIAPFDQINSAIKKTKKHLLTPNF